jgi:hypothetical protein
MPPKFRGQPRKANGEFASKGGGSSRSTTRISAGVTGSFKTYKKADGSGTVRANTPGASSSKKAPTKRADRVTKRAEALNAAGKNKKAQQTIQSALARNKHQLAEVNRKIAESKARQAESKAKVKRINYKLKHGLAGASDATVDAHMAANKKKKR